MVKAQVAELAQVKVESASRMPVRIFGTIHAHMFANSDNANWLENPNLVDVPLADGGGGTFSGTLRQTRLGLSDRWPDARIGADERCRGDGFLRRHSRVSRPDR